MNKRNKIYSLFCILLGFFILFSLSSCKDKPNTNHIQNDTSVSSSATSLGEGDTTFALTVVTDDGKKELFNINTNKSTVGEALMELGFIKGEMGPYGLYVKTVNSVTYDYDKDGKYWAFYVNGEYSVFGVDATGITQGASYMFKAE